MKKQEYPQIVKFSEKHGDWYYLLKDAEHSKKTALHILKTRYEEGWYDWMKDSKPYQKKPEFTQADIDGLGEKLANTKKTMQNELDIYLKSEKVCEKDRSNYEKIKIALENQQGNTAWNLLQKFADGEYESFEIIDLIEVE